jgi:hypothetical protein
MAARRGSAAWLLAVAFALAACANASTRRVVAPDGKPAFEIRCQVDDSGCLRAADEACPKNGHEMLKIEDSGWPRGSGAFQATMLFRCRPAAAAAKPAAPPGADAPDKKTGVRRPRH